MLRTALAVAGFLAWTGALPVPLSGQSARSATLAYLVQDGLRYVEQRRYGDAINSLEEAWERDPSNAVVAEHLALAYLYERIPPGNETLEKAGELMEISLENGGRVSVFARHLHGGRLKKIVSTDDSCPGKLTLGTDGLQFQPSYGDHSFALDSEELQSVVPSKSKHPINAGRFTLQTREGKRYRLRTGTHTRAEAEIVLRLVREFLLGG